MSKRGREGLQSGEVQLLAETIIRRWVTCTQRDSGPRLLRVVSLTSVGDGAHLQVVPTAGQREPVPEGRPHPPRALYELDRHSGLFAPAASPRTDPSAVGFGRARTLSVALWLTDSTFLDFQ